MSAETFEALSSCVEWQKARDREGYGIVGTRKHGTRKAHRVAWIQAHGPIPVGLAVCHHCDNPPCVNVSHLFLGTLADNAADRDVKGRTARQGWNAKKTHCPYGHILTERAGFDHQRFCVPCRNAASRRYRERKKSELSLVERRAARHDYETDAEDE